MSFVFLPYPYSQSSTSGQLSYVLEAPRHLFESTCDVLSLKNTCYSKNNLYGPNHCPMALSFWVPSPGKWKHGYTKSSDN